MIAALSVAIAVAGASAASSSSMPARARFPQVLSHRGASGYIPEHSLHAYQLAIDLG
jgi:glycerophosphoryl diester phosphodiesterase